MVKNITISCLSILLLIVFLPIEYSKASTVNTSLSCSNQIINPGQWTGKITRTLTTDQILPGMEIKSTVYFQADILLNVTCNIVSSGYFYVSHDDFSDIVTGSDNIPGKVSHSDVCHAAGTYTVTQGTVTGTPSHPFITVTANVNYTTIDCPSFPSAGKVPPVTFSMPAQSATSSKITGNSYDVNGSMSQIMSNLEKVHTNVIRIENWVLNVKFLEPDISNLSAQFKQFFLAGIPLKNDYTATVDWKNNQPGHVNWTLDNQTTTGTMNGDVSTQSYELSQLPPGTNPLTAIAISPNGNTSPVANGSIIMVPLDPWATEVNFHANPQGDEVIYNGIRSFPRNVLQFFVDIPSVIPFVGGKWGLLPTQFNIHLSASSLGGDKTDSIEGHSGFSFGKDSFNINVNGQSDTVLTANSLTVDNTKTVANLLKETKTFSQQASLLSVVPVASSLFNIPILGPVIKALNSVASVNGQITVSAQGNAHLGINSAKTDLTLTSGEINSSVQVQATAGINIGLVFAGVGGGGTGALDLTLNPAPSVKDCLLQLNFIAFAGIFGIRILDVNQPFDILSCQQTGMASTIIPAGYFRQILTPKNASYTDNSVNVDNTSSLTNGITSTQTITLAENVSPGAQPYLAIAQDGDMAITWMTSIDKSNALSNGIAYRFYHAGSWSNVIQVDSSGHPDFNPVAAFDKNGDLLIVWNQSQLTALPANYTINEEFARSLKIVYAIIDPKLQNNQTSAHIIKSGLLSEDFTLNFNPQIASANGSVWVAWENSPSTNFVSTKVNPNQLQAVVWNGSNWGKVETVDDKLTGTLFISLATTGSSNAMIAYDIDTVGDLLSATNRDIYLAIHNKNGWMPPLRITNNQVMDTAPHAAYTPDGKPILAWLRDNQVVGLVGDLKASPQTWLDSSMTSSAGLNINFGNGLLVAGQAGSLSLLWSGLNPNGPNVMISIYDPATMKWDTPKPLLNIKGQPRSLSAGLSNDGSLSISLVLAKINTLDGQLTNGSSATIPDEGNNANLMLIQTASKYTTQPNKHNIIGVNSRFPVELGLACLLIAAVAGFTGFIFLRQNRKSYRERIPTSR